VGEQGDAPLAPRAHTLSRGIHALPYSDTEGESYHILVAVTSKGVRVGEIEVHTSPEREGAIDELSEMLDECDPADETTRVRPSLVR